MGDFYKSLMLNVFKVLQLPGDVEGDVDGRGPDVKGRGNVTLQGVTYHQQILWEDVQMLTELLELHFSFVRRNLHMGEVLA